MYWTSSAWFYRWWNWSMGRVRNLPNALQLINSTVGIQTQLSGSCILNHYHVQWPDMAPAMCQTLCQVWEYCYWPWGNRLVNKCYKCSLKSGWEGDTKGTGRITRKWCFSCVLLAIESRVLTVISSIFLVALWHRAKWLTSLCFSFPICKIPARWQWACVTLQLPQLGKVGRVYCCGLLLCYRAGHWDKEHLLSNSSSLAFTLSPCSFIY